MKKQQITCSVFLIFTLLLMFSCSQDYETENTNIDLQENFVELSKAKDIAEEIYFENKTNTSSSNKRTSNKSTKRTIKNLNEIKNGKGKTSFYVINYNEGGFIILSADKRIEPIIGYSENSKFDTDEGLYPLGLKFWIEDTKKQITGIQNSNIEQSDVVKLAWEKVEHSLTSSNNSIFAKPIDPDPDCYEHEVTVTVGPLLYSTWGQLGGFNDALPFITCDGFPFQVFAGCVPIAMGQVMKYYEHPTNYTWTSMPWPSATATTANFISDIHDAIDNVYPDNPSYFCDGTGVSTSANMGNVLKTEFDYSFADWGNYDYLTVKSNLDNNRPVILSGDNGVAGHMWVCDGYTQTSYYFDDCTGIVYYPRFYMNWGWDGNFNGYYAYYNFNPANTNFNNNKKMIYNIIP